MIQTFIDRLGDNFNNDKRLLKGSSITISKMKSICDKLDMKCTLIISDSNPNVPNPIGQEIKVDICGYDENYEDK